MSSSVDSMFPIAKTICIQKNAVRRCYSCASTTTYVDKHGHSRWYRNMDTQTQTLIGWLCNSCWMHLRRKLQSPDERMLRYRHVANKLRGRKRHGFSGENHPFYGKSRSEITRLKISARLKGRKSTTSELERLKKTQFKKGQIPWIAGRKHSFETIMKVRANRNCPHTFRDTKPERIIQAELTKLGIKYETQKRFRIDGESFHSVDIFIEPRLCVNIDGCFWHGCPVCFPDETKYTEPQRNNIIRDEIVMSNLTEGGYKLIRLWEHDIYDNLNRCVVKIVGGISNEC